MVCVNELHKYERNINKNASPLLLSIVRVVDRRGMVDAEADGVLAGAAQRDGDAAAAVELAAALVRARDQLVLARATVVIHLDAAAAFSKRKLTRSLQSFCMHLDDDISSN